jgi:CheY-like chemotaxis protein
MGDATKAQKMNLLPMKAAGEQDFPDVGRVTLQHQESSAYRNRLVLIVETVPRYLESLREQLMSLGYWVVIARSGTEAIEKARRLQPCVVLLNPLLPLLSGWDVLTILKSDAQTLHIPIFVTATQAEKQQAEQNKADGFLSLPVQESALVQCLTGLNQQSMTPSSNLTILHLSPEFIGTGHDLAVRGSELTTILSLQHSEFNVRVLEADDLEQAELLARVWHPDVILLDTAGIADPLAYLQDFSLHHALTKLPLVTLDRQTTEAANQVTGLAVYPCLASDRTTKIAALLQVLQVAVGMTPKPSILAIEVSEVQQETQMPHKTRHKKIRGEDSADCAPLTPQSLWLQALIQYLQTAGFRSLHSCSWTEVYRQIQDQSVDLLLIRLKDISDAAALGKKLIALTKLEKLPAILVLDHRSPAEKLGESVTGKDESIPDLELLLGGVATQILRGSSLSMSQLLEQINQALASNNS